MPSLASSARRLLVISVVARLPLTTLSIGLLVHARHLTGSFAAAGGAYAVEAAAVELPWVAGPPIALGLGALWSTGAALALGGAALFVATAVFACDPASCSWRPDEAVARERGGSLRSPAMRVL